MWNVQDSTAGLPWTTEREQSPFFALESLNYFVVVALRYRDRLSGDELDGIRGDHTDRIRVEEHVSGFDEHLLCLQSDGFAVRRQFQHL